MKPTILTTMPVSLTLHDRLSGLYALHRLPEGAGPDAVPDLARGARALITLGSLRTDTALMDALPELGLICCYGTGFEGVDRTAAARRGIVVTNAGDANAASVAEFAVGLMLTASRDILIGDRLVRAGGWTSLKLDRMPLVPGLAGRRLGIYGLGAIGMRIAQRAAAFDMAIGYHNRSPRPDVSYAFHGSLMDLARWADVLMVAVRAGTDNRHAVNRDILAALGRDGLLVNISRGIAVDEAALCEALETGAIAGAALDVYEDEPQVPDRLKALPNVVLTPHMAALSSAAQGAQQEILLGNLEAFFAGRPIRWQVPPA
ncbi:2-hydroxyacid dehydrogenase [Roseomonas hellenica]|uniref:2-hydroxyacid dehydrogenase n=1 Tax=Plastoroseomonas hellenica TaxID=2687306 RepID=A0ABS5EWF0_9PROT|nr:2-hydroxyacid dehydrogenase [Plastoroseomonas hellenica]MBR0664618.1 2-hydroxyacid dehydrogenase [Plastoroseomonas hellenica]